MNKFLKAVSLMTATFLSASALAGCGKSDSAIGGGGTVTLNGDSIYPISCEDTLTYWFNGTDSWTEKYENFADTPIGKEVAKKTGVKVEYIHPMKGQEAEQMQIMLASDELPDIVNSTWSTFAGGPDAAIEQEYILKLNDVFEKYCPALTKVLSENPEWDKQVKSDKGNYFVFPSMCEGELTLVAYGPVMRVDLLEKLGLSEPRNISEWESVLTAFKENGVEVPFLGDFGFLQKGFGPAFGVYQNWYLNGNNVVYGQAQPEYKEFLTKMNDWYEKGLIDPDFAVMDWDKWDAYMLNGKSVSTLAYAGSAIGKFMRANNTEGYSMTGVQYPAMGEGTGNAEYSDLGKAVPMGTTTAISANCKNVELAARFLDWGFTEDGYSTYNFGIDGESYNWTEINGVPYPLYSELITNNPEGIPIGTMLSEYTRSCHVNVPMVQSEEYIKQYYPLPHQKNAQTQWAKTNMKAHLLPQIYVANEVADEDADIMAAVKTYVDEMTVKFISGREPIEKFDEYLNELDKFGLGKSIKYRQEAYERYLSR